jgi:methionyl-tRNA synthetase
VNKPKRYTVTSALIYANGPAHIGHIAGAYLPADIYVRYLRSNGEDVLFVCGSDEHGAAITIRAKQDGLSPQEIVDKYNGMLRDGMAGLGIEFDVYHRTSSKLHHDTASEYFTALHEKGVFEEKESEQYYDEENEQFLADRYITGKCPKPDCGNESAYGDQCEKCGSALSPTELINPTSVMSGKTPVMRKTSHWYLPMGDHEKWLGPWLEEGVLDGEQHHDPKQWKAHVLGQCKSWIESGLHSRAMTRDLSWGVPVPVKGAEGKVLYVWLDAPIGYISASKQWSADTGKDWEPYWKDNDTKLVHFIGKDNIVFHCIIFPILLKAHGDYILPTNVPANSFLNLEGRKISTSKNWAVWVHEYLEEFPDKVDELRYVMTAIAPESRDSEFTWDGWKTKVNDELVAKYGNFVNRSLVLTQKYYEGKVPARDVMEAIDTNVLADAAGFPDRIGALIEKYSFKEAQQEAMRFAELGNKYLADTEPWKLYKDEANEGRVRTIMNVALQLSATMAIIFEPFLPNSSAKLFTMLNISPLTWESAGLDGLIADGTQLPKPSLLFQKLDDKMVAEQQQKLIDSQKTAASNPDAAPAKPEATFEDFQKLDIRTAVIISAKKHDNADALLVIEVDTGLDVRTVVSGIAKHYAPEGLVGQQVSVLLNLAPRKIRGIESQGMILMAENEKGELAFVSPTKEFVQGSVIR